MAIASPRVFGKAFCEAFGIDFHRLKSIRLDCSADAAPTITVKRLIDEDRNGIETLGGDFKAQLKSHRVQEEIYEIAERP